MPRYLNLSELAHVRWLASEAMRKRRPRKARRVRAFALMAAPHPEPPPRPHGPIVPLPRQPVDHHLGVLRTAVDGLRGLAGSV